MAGEKVKYHNLSHSERPLGELVDCDIRRDALEKNDALSDCFCASLRAEDAHEFIKPNEMEQFTSANVIHPKFQITSAFLWGQKTFIKTAIRPKSPTCGDEVGLFSPLIQFQ